MGYLLVNRVLCRHGMALWRLASLRYKDPLSGTRVLIPCPTVFLPTAFPIPFRLSHIKPAGCAPAPRSSALQLDVIRRREVVVARLREALPGAAPERRGGRRRQFALSLSLSSFGSYVSQILGLNCRSPSTTPTLTLEPSHSKMNPLIPKSGPP